MTSEDLDWISAELGSLTVALADAECRWASWIAAVAPENHPSAVNLVHYWAMRQRDLRDLQTRLTRLGLTSLGLSESHVQATLAAVATAVAALQGKVYLPPAPPTVGFGAGQRILERNAADLLGPGAADNATRIMVTLPSEAAADASLVERLVDRGMAVARINCAHDDAQAWRSMAAKVRAAAAHAGRSCLIAMDLGGPKLRTGPLQPGPKVLRLKPVRNELGQVLSPARGWLTSETAPAPAPDGLPTLPVGGGWLRQLCKGDVLELRDTRESRRWLEVDEVSGGGAVITCEQTVYFGTGTTVHLVGSQSATQIGELAPVEQVLRLRAGDLLEVTRDLAPAPVDAVPPRVGCTLPEVFDSIEVGERVFFDDGKFGAEVTAVGADSFEVRIDHPSHASTKLRAGKGINVPDTDLPISALTAKDIADLETVVEVADIVQLSFVREPADVARLLDELDRLGDRDLGVVLKIETRTGFEHLPQLALMAMRRPRVGVMIARGDLAVECGHERLAEVQEEILWLCEAGHLPVIWATQVLDQLARTGLPSRAEISDAALGERAECVMLNKGPYIDDAVETLHDILTRMAGHQRKQSSLLRPLRSWQPAATQP